LIAGGKTKDFVLNYLRGLPDIKALLLSSRGNIFTIGTNNRLSIKNQNSVRCQEPCSGTAGTSAKRRAGFLASLVFG